MTETIRTDERFKDKFLESIPMGRARGDRRRLRLLGLPGLQLHDQPDLLRRRRPRPRPLTPCSQRNPAPKAWSFVISRWSSADERSEPVYRDHPNHASRLIGASWAP